MNLAIAGISRRVASLALLHNNDLPKRPDVSSGPTILLDGQVLAWRGKTDEVVSPVCRAEFLDRIVIGALPSFTADEAMIALNASVRAWNKGTGAWPTAPVSERIKAMMGFVDEMKKERENVVRLLMWEIGKNRVDSEKEFDRTIEYIIRTCIALRNAATAEANPTVLENVQSVVRRAPLGVTLCMGPFNYPLNETFTTLIPALIMGNTVVVKPPKFGGLTMQALLPAFAKCFPPGVVNTIYGDGQVIIGPIMASGKLDVLAFIGSSKVADIIKKQHPQPHRLRSILGLDAKNPALVMPDADLDATVKEVTAGALTFNGQRCTGLKLIFVHESVLEPFLEKLSASVEALSIGMPWDNAQITPLVEWNKAEWLTGLITDAQAKGAKIVNAETGGGTYAGTLFKPAILCPVSPDANIYSWEQFGPVIPVVPYHDEQEFLDFVVNSSFGQQTSLFGKDSVKIGHLIDQLSNQVCRININTQCQRGPDNLPFTGRKDSAEGTLSITDALRCFSIRSMVATAIPNLWHADSTHTLLDVAEHSNFLKA